MNELDYETIQDCETYIRFGIKDNGHFEQELYYIPDEEIFINDWFIPKDILTKIKDNWYYLEGKHENI